MNSVIVGLIASYLTLTCYLGFRAQRQSRTSAEDYFLAERDVSFLHLGLTFFATWFSTLAFLGVAGFNYSRGVSWYFAQGTFWMLAPIAAWLIGRRIWLLGKTQGYITPGDLLGDLYKSNFIKLLSGTISILSLIPYVLVQLVGIGKVFEASTSGSISYSLGVVITAIATCIYTVAGGVRAVIWTDVVQGILFLSVCLLAAYIAIDVAGGLSHGLLLAQETRPEVFSFDISNIGAPLTTIIIWTPGLVLLPHLWQRSYMAKSEKAFTKGIAVFSSLSLVLLFSTMLVGATAISFMPSLSDSDKLIPILFRDHAVTFLPLLVLATFAAGMSTIDSQLLSASSVLLRDVLAPLGLRITAKKEQLVGRIIIISLLILLSWLALLPESQGAIFTLASKGTSLAFLLLLPLLASWGKKQHTAFVGISLILTGVLCYTALELDWIVFELPYGFGTVITAFLVQLVIYLGLKFSSRK